MPILVFIGLVVLVLSWSLNAIIVRTPLFPNLFRVPRLKYQKKKKVKLVKQEVIAQIERMPPEERKSTNWVFFARDYLRDADISGYYIDEHELYQFIATTLTKRGWR